MWYWLNLAILYSKISLIILSSEHVIVRDLENVSCIIYKLQSYISSIIM